MRFQVSHPIGYKSLRFHTLSGTRVSGFMLGSPAVCVIAGLTRNLQRLGDADIRRHDGAIPAGTTLFELSHSYYRQNNAYG